MTIKIKKAHFIFITLIVFGIVFYVKHYNIIANPEINVTIKLDKRDAEIKFDNLELVLLRVDKPWYYMQMETEMASVSPNLDGKVSFRLRKSESYAIDIYTEEREVYCSGISFDTDSLKDSQIVSIPVKYTQKIQFPQKKTYTQQ